MPHYLWELNETRALGIGKRRIVGSFASYTCYELVLRWGKRGRGGDRDVTLLSDRRRPWYAG